MVYSHSFGARGRPRVAYRCYFLFLLYPPGSIPAAVVIHRTFNARLVIQIVPPSILVHLSQLAVVVFLFMLHPVIFCFVTLHNALDFSVVKNRLLAMIVSTWRCRL